MTYRPSVLVVHNRYQQPGGEDDCVRDDVELLTQNGHRVATLEVSNAEIRDASPATGARAVWSIAGSRLVRDAVKRHAPDVVHFHNTFPLLSPSAYRAAAIQGVTVVQTVHNARLVCIGATLTRDGAECRECVGRMPARGVLHRCYRSSLPASLSAATMLTVNRMIGSYRRWVHAYLPVSDFIRQALIQGGLPADRISTRYYFAPVRPIGHGGGNYVLFAGRLSTAKGLGVLLDAWQMVNGEARLLIAGDGDLRPRAEELAAVDARVQVLGWLDRADLLDLVREAQAVVAPSIDAEAAPRVVLDAMSVGTPVVASAVGALPELVGPWGGCVVQPRDPVALAAAIDRVITGDQTELRHQALAWHREAFTPEASYERLVDAYAMASAAVRQ